jgi:hypothetical protein
MTGFWMVLGSRRDQGPQVIWNLLGVESGAIAIAVQVGALLGLITAAAAGAGGRGVTASVAGARSGRR